MADNLDLGWSLGVLFRTWQTTVEGVVGTLPHGPRGYQILNTLDSGSPTQAELALHLGIDRTVLTYVIDDLVRESLVERQTDARDRRRRRLVLTGAGSRRLAELRSEVAAAEAGLFPGLAGPEAEALRTLLERAAAGLHAGRGEHDACTVVAAILDAAERA